MKKTAVIIILIAMAAIVMAAQPSYVSPVIRVKLLALDRAVAIAGTDLRWKAGGQTGAGAAIRLSGDSQGAAINGARAALPIEISAHGPLSVDGVSFRGMILVTPGSPPLLLNLVDLESYVAGVINQEIDSKWPAAVVDAQAILIRTYALKRRVERANQPFDLDRTVSDQVYGGVAAEDNAAWAAEERTRGLVLSYDNHLASAFYHSCCGGRTEVPSAVWGGADAPYQQAVNCKYCQDAPHYFWRFPDQGLISGRELSDLLGLGGEVRAIRIPERTPSGRAARIELETAEKTLYITGQEFREWLGFDRLWSTAFQVDQDGAGFVFRGSGSGHGVGMCQWGARGLAAIGSKAKAILAFYFPGAKVASWESLDEPISAPAH